LKSVSYEIAHDAYHDSGKYANERILKNGSDGGRGFCCEPCDVVDNAHKHCHKKRSLEVANLRDDNRRQNHERKRYRAELNGHEAEYYRERKHECDKAYTLYFLKSFRFHITADYKL